MSSHDTIGHDGRAVITDAQVHVWSRVAEPGRQHRPHPFGAEQLLRAMDEAGVDRAVLIPPTWAADGNAVALQSAQRSPSRFRVMGLLDPRMGEERDRIRSWTSTPGMLGIRISLHAGIYREMVLDRSLEWLWAEAEMADVPLMLYPPGLLREVGDIARRHAGLRLIVDHFGAPLERGPRALEEAVTQLLDLAPLQNVAVKVSAVPWYSTAGYPFEDVHESLCRAVDAFGPRRAFWGSDLTRLPCSYADTVLMMRTLRCLDQRDLELVMGEAISRWLDWPGGSREPSGSV